MPRCVRAEGGASRQPALARGSCWVGRRCAATPLRCSRRGRAAELTSLAGARFVQTTATSQMTKRAGARRPRRCASRRPRNRPWPMPAAAREAARRSQEPPPRSDALRRPSRIASVITAPRQQPFRRALGRSVRRVGPGDECHRDRDPRAAGSRYAAETAAKDLRKPPTYRKGVGRRAAAPIRGAEHRRACGRARQRASSS